MKRLRLFTAFTIFLLIAAMSFGITGVQAAEPKIPNPTREFYFNDFAGVLEPSTGREIVRLGESVNKSTGGGQVVFVSIEALGDSTIEEYANTLFNKWKIGTKDKGILFIISMEDRESRIEVGYGYEGVLTDLESNKLLTKFSELYNEKGIDEAVRTIYRDICSIVSGDGDSVLYPDSSRTRGSDAGSSFVEEHPLLTIIGVIVILILVILDFVLTGGRVTFFILRMAAASGRRGGGGRNSGGGGRSGGGGSSSRF